jgi:hypothetical protein
MQIVAKVFISFTFLLIVEQVFSQEVLTGFDRKYVLLESRNYVQDKNFYFCTLLQQIEPVRQVMSEGDYFSQLLEYKMEGINQGVKSCSLSISCHADIFLWDPDEVEAVSYQLYLLFKKSKEVQEIVGSHMRNSGMFQKYASLPDEELLINAWEEAARGMNYIINTYAFGGEQRYPAIDSVSYDINSDFYRRLINSVSHTIWDEMDRYDLFFQPALDFSLLLLDINGRNESARFEPLRTLENKAAFQSIPGIKWNDYPYSVILVPGSGPEEPDVALSPMGKLRNKLAAARYRDGWAPLIIVSGGYVHPFQTRYNEALEMKKDLMNAYHIPEQAIIIEPHARHTTTNFRNSARIMFRYGIPADKMAVVTTSLYQSYYIGDMNLDERCLRELGYIPYTLFDRISKFDIEFKPMIESLHADPLDPLDP